MQKSSLIKGVRSAKDVLEFLGRQDAFRPSEQLIAVGAQDATLRFRIQGAKLALKDPSQERGFTRPPPFLTPFLTSFLTPFLTSFLTPFLFPSLRSILDPFR